MDLHTDVLLELFRDADEVSGTRGECSFVLDLLHLAREAQTDAEFAGPDGRLG